MGKGESRGWEVGGEGRRRAEGGGAPQHGARMQHGQDTPHQTENETSTHTLKKLQSPNSITKQPSVEQDLAGYKTSAPHGCGGTVVGTGFCEHRWLQVSRITSVSGEDLVI